MNISLKSVFQIIIKISDSRIEFPGKAKNVIFVGHPALSFATIIWKVHAV